MKKLIAIIGLIAILSGCTRVWPDCDHVNNEIRIYKGDKVVTFEELKNSKPSLNKPVRFYKYCKDCNRHYKRLR